MILKKSLATKNALVYFIIFLFGILIQGGVLYYYSSNTILKRSEKQLNHTADLTRQKIGAYISELQNDVLHLSNSPFLEAYLLNQTSEQKSLLEGEYVSIIASKPHYAQIRFIGLENSGKEQIRVDKDDSVITIVAEHDLQEKGSREYFQESIKLDKNSVYVSRINLNREHGQISLPKMPTLRVASPVFYKNELKGVFIINANLNWFFEELTSVVNEDVDLFLVNSDGHYLVHPDPKQSFGFEYDESAWFLRDFDLTPVEMHRNKKENFLKDDIVYHLDLIDFPKDNYDLFVLIAADQSLLLADYFQWKRDYIILVLSILLFLSLIAFYYLNGQAKKLSVITKKLKEFPETLESTNLPVDREDEIGALAQSFQEMADIINTNISSLRDAREKAEQADYEKQEFLENMSHEIRNPLHSIFGLSEVLEQNQYLPHQKELIQNLKFNAGNLNSLLNDILDYKKLLQNELKLQPQWESLSDLIKAIYSSHQYIAGTKKLNYTYSYPDTVDQKEFYVDKLRLSQVVNNLIINAIKFTPEAGNVSFDIEFNEQGGEALLRFQVKDSGVGIEPQFIEKIKERYHSAATEQHFLPSQGIGLNVVVQLLKCFGAQLEVNSEKDKGSVFSFVISCKCRMIAAAPKKDLEHMPLLSQKKLLILDDDEQVLNLYKYIFSPLAELTVLNDTRGLEGLSKQFFDITICDYRIGRHLLTDEKECINSLLKPQGMLYVISAQEIDSLQKHFPLFKRSFQKPIEPLQLTLSICRDIGEQQYGIPDTDDIKKDYDYDRKKYNRALQLLINEWHLLSDRIAEAVKHYDQEELFQISHKMITSAKRLRLSWLEQTLPQLENLTREEVRETAASLRQAIRYYISCIKEDLD